MATLTGRRVFAITASAFGVIIGVNVLLAVQAVRTFPGLEVNSSYVASQSFDRNRRAQEALGWTLRQDYGQGKLTLAFTLADGSPAPVGTLTAVVGRATEAADDVVPVFARTGSTFTAPLSLGPGKWVVLLDAMAEDGTLYHKRLDLSVRG
jgi:nitrogen fixation protein FixH